MGTGLCRPLQRALQTPRHPHGNAGQRYRERYRGEDAEVLRQRRETMLEARRRHPERWITGRVLNCTPIKEVWLNPENGQMEEKHARAA